MLAPLLHAGGQGEELCFAAGQGLHIGDAGLAFRNGAGLVHDDGVDGVSPFQGFAGLDEDAVFRALPRADHDGDRRCQP